MEFGRRLTVAVHPSATLAARERLFAALEQAFAVTFVPWEPEGTPVDALLVGASEAIPAVDVPVLAFVAQGQPAAGAEEVRFADHAAVDRRLRGIALPDHRAAPRLDAGAGDTVLALGASGLAWTRAAGAPTVDRVRAALPELGDDEGLRDAARPERALALVALIDLLRRLGAERAEQPPLRATFLFDDPNLHRPSYGYIDYRRLVAHADAHGYHAAMAMIPLDVRLPNAAAVEAFRSRADRLSLVIHGNNHENRELMQEQGLDSALRLCAQALRRIAGFEARTGLLVDRVMTPPHGLCSRTVAEALGALGYDALCAIHPCPWTERPPASRPLAGWGPAGFVAGCAVVPRVPIDCSPAEVALRAFMGQPIVLYGHHDDLADGLEPLAAAAARVNAMGDVRWTSLGEIVATNYALSLEDGRASIAAFGRRVRVTLPPGVTELTVTEPAGGAQEAGLSGWSTIGGERTPFGASRARVAAGDVEVRLHALHEVDPWQTEAPPWRAWPLVRRAATETRDRLLPLRAALN
jgi:hypothetical protein